MTRSSVLSSTRALAVGLALGMAVTLLPAQPSAAGPKRVSSRLFGMTDSDPLSWPEAKVGAIRLWDSGVTWRQIETRPGRYDFTRLDAAVATARRNRAQVLLVLGQTPQFHATKPKLAGYNGPGSASMPTISSWRNYVATVVRRYKGRGLDYQVWNEANVPGFWGGTPKEMATLTKVAAKVLAKNDKAADLVSPALATRLTGQRRWLRDFYAVRTGGRPVGDWVDVVSLQLYPLPQDGPEDSMALLAASRTMLAELGVDKPIWNTEINYGLQTGGGGTARNIPRGKQAAFVARTYILNAAAGVKRVYWYSWDLRDLANTELSLASGTPTRAGVAYQVVRDWLTGAAMQGCVRDRRGTYTCSVTYSDGVRRIYWNPSRKVSITTAPSATLRTGLQGFTEKLRGGESLRVGREPIMVRSRR